jgi:TonB family protein
MYQRFCLIFFSLFVKFPSIFCIFFNTFELYKEKTGMSIRIIFLIFFSIMVIDQLYAQTAPPKVVFKVRKPHSSPVRVVDEKYQYVVAEQVFVVVEENATFMGGDLETFRAWVLEHLVYPDSAAKLGIEGKVILSFVVNPKGIIEKTVVLRGVDSALNNEAIRVVTSSPKWVPGRQGGKNISQQFTIPIAFKLQK